jgi:N-acetylglucosamine malate deacetylase 1
MSDSHILKELTYMSFDLVAFGPHPDDAELFCGGTLARMVKKGYRAAIVDLTRGERGTRGDAETRQREAACAAKVLGVHHRENAEIPDTEILVTLENRNRLIQIIRRLSPRLVVAPYFEGRHPDHVNASKLVYDACFYSGLKNYPLPGEATRPYKLLYAIRHKEYFPPSFVVDITAEFDTKIEAVKCYSSQFLDRQEDREDLPSTTTLFERISSFASFCGVLIAKRYGEAFYMKEIFEVDDPLKLTVASI